MSIVRKAGAARGAGTLVVRLDGIDVQSVSVGVEPCTIGRLPSNRVVLPHPAVSRHHAEVRIDGGRVVLVDGGSAGGTLVDGLPLLPGQPVGIDDTTRIGIGPFELSFIPIPPEVLAAARALEPGAPVVVVSVPVHPDDDDAPAVPVVPGRPTFVAVHSAPGHSRYLEQLPALFQESDFLGRMLLIYESIWEPLEQRQDHLPMYFDPATCPAPMLAFLASWLSLELDPHWPEARRRHLLAEAMDLYRWRGTVYGLGRMLEVCTGLPVQVTEDPALPFVVRVAVTVPPKSAVRVEFVESLVRAHKPAHVGYVLEVGP